MRNFIRILVIASVGLLAVQTTGYAQVKPKKGTHLPGKSPEQEEKETMDKVKELSRDSDKPMTKRQGHKFMKKRDKNSAKEYDKHHNRIQQKDTYKRMKKNDKKSKMMKKKKNPGAFRRLFM